MGRKAALRPLSEQVVVVTGGSSGIGRETAIRLGRAGATVIVTARREASLLATVDAVRDAGGRAEHIVCDVTDAAAVQGLADRVERTHGRIDTWVGNAGVLVYGKFWQTRPEEFRRILEVNFLGQVNGILAALPALRRAGGGALVCVSSAEASVTLPTHSAYAASKRALEGALDGLRRELISDGIPISVTAVRPAVIDTPIFTHARNHMERGPAAPPPYYDPAVVAEAIAFAAEHPVRTIHAGGGARAIAAMQMLAPGAVDAVFGRVGIHFMRTDEPAAPTPDNLDDALGGDGSRGWLPRRGRRWSATTWLATHPRLGAATALTATVLGAGAVGRLRRR